MQAPDIIILPVGESVAFLAPFFNLLVDPFVVRVVEDAIAYRNRLGVHDLSFFCPVTVS